LLKRTSIAAWHFTLSKEGSDKLNGLKRDRYKSFIKAPRYLALFFLKAFELDPIFFRHLEI
jgi:hypothetical protein